ncbi:MAG: hypothetical protein AB1633_00230 [Elusimicrobiota bacterium]
MAKTTVPGHQVLDGSIKDADIASDAAIVLSKLGLISSLTEKTTPADADVVPIADSAASNAWKKLSWSNIKTALSSLFASKDNVQAGSIIYAADSGSTDAYAITLTPAPSAYTAGMVIHFKANTANTGACTLNVNSLGAKTIKKNYNSDLADNDIKAGQFVSVIYDGTNFQLLSPIANVPSGGATIISAVKTADETVNNSSTYQDDDHLTVTVTANKTYIVELYMPVAQSAIDAYFHAQFVAPTGATIAGSPLNLTEQTDYLDGFANYSRYRTLMEFCFLASISPAGVTGDGTVRYNGVLVVSSTGGIFKVQWAQYVAVANNTTVKKGAYLKLTEI